MSYDCVACVGYCCAYPIIRVRSWDVSRLAKGLGIDSQEVIDKYIDLENSLTAFHMKRTPDPVLEADSCVFLDKETRQCTVYEHRPDGCREHPDSEICEWWDRWTLESGRKAVRLKLAPWTIDGKYPEYKTEEDRERVRNEYGR